MSIMGEVMEEHVASLADDGGMGDEIEDRIASEQDEGAMGADDEGFTEPSETDESGALPTDEASEPTLEAIQAQVAEVKKESDGRLAALVDQREKLRQANEGIESMRNLMLEWERKASQPSPEEEAARLAEEYGADVVADPNNRFVADRIRAFEERQERIRQEEEGRKRQVAEQIQNQSAERHARQQAFIAVKQQEGAFKEAKPDYEDAYTHMRQSREKFYQTMYPGHDVTALLDREEEVVVAETLRAGGNVAERVYKSAIEMGYTPKEAREAAEENSEEARMFRERKARVEAFRKDNEFPDVARLKEAKSDSKLGDGTYNRGGNARTMKGEQVFEQLPKAKRMALFADPDKFKQFVLTGELEV